MSGLQRAMRHPDRRSDAHARARALSSDRLLAPLEPDDAAWLRDHLHACAPCRRMADSFAADRAGLRTLRRELPLPPRDLGARLSRALDVEVRRAVREDARRGRRSFVGSPPFALAGIAVLAVLAVAFLPLALAGLGIANAPVPGPGASGGPAGTPMVVATQSVAWVQRGADGGYVLTSAPVDRVCPGLDASACGTLDGVARPIVALNLKPSAVVLQHNGTSAVLVSHDALYAFSVPRDEGVTRTPAPSSSVPTPGAPSPTPAVTGVGATPPAATPVPTGPPSPPATSTPPPASAEPAVSSSAGPTAPVVTASLSPSGEPAATLVASEAPTPAASILSIPPASPAPSAAVTTAIIEGVALVGGPPAYSADGRWVAFSARPSDGSQGPDIYVWLVGDARARQLTTDHASVFSAWYVDQILGSAILPAGSTGPETSAVTITPVASPAAASPVGESPAAPTPAGGSPSGQGPAGASAQPSTTPASTASPSPAVPRGRVPPSATSDATPRVSPDATPRVSPGATPRVSPDATPRVSPETTPSPAAASAAPSVPVVSFLLDPTTGARTQLARPGVWRPVVDPTNRSVVFWVGDQAPDPATNTWIPTAGRLVVADWQALVGPGDVSATPLPGSAGLPGVNAWDVRWDPSGRHLAVWIADVADSSMGRLSLFAVNPDGSVGDTLLQEIAALPGLSLGSDRLAWASPPGQNGQGSTINVYAWSEGGAGSLRGAPDPGTEELVVVR